MIRHIENTYSTTNIFDAETAAINEGINFPILKIQNK